MSKKRISNRNFKKVLKHLESLPLIEWTESLCTITDSYKDSFETSLGDLIISFDWLTHNGNNSVSVVPVNIYNNDKGFDYDINDFQFLELEKAAKSLFNLDTEDYEGPEEHAFNIGE